MIIRHFIWLLTLRSVVAVSSFPNIVIHLADDMGIGDIGCYGNTTLRTPNIDRLAGEGIRLTQHLAAESICTPSRAALLTGRYPIRSGLAPDFVPVLISLPSIGGLPAEEVTFSEQAKKAGYRTALVGKWHLGVFDFFRNPVHHPMNQGFDRFYGIPLGLSPEWGGDTPINVRAFPNLNRNALTTLGVLVISLLMLWKINVFSIKLCFIIISTVVIVIAHFYIQIYGGKFHNSVLMRNHEVIEKPGRLIGLTQRFAAEAIEFIREVSKEGKPFLLFMSWGHTHSYLAPSEKFAGKTQHGRYGDCVEELDWGIGLVNDVLDELHLKENTLVYFTSDNGGDRWEGGGYNGIYKGGKAQCTVEGGIRAPGLIRFPGRIPANTTSDIVTSHLDIFPLVSHLTGVPLPANTTLDGENIMGLLEGKPDYTPKRQFLMHYSQREITAVRYMPRGGDTVWKVAYKVPDSIYIPGTTVCEMGACDCKPLQALESPLLYNLTADPSEMHSIRRGEHPDYESIVEKVVAAVEDHQSTLEPVPSQLTPLKVVWFPHLLNCCNLPMCRCTESKYSDDELK